MKYKVIKRFYSIYGTCCPEGAIIGENSTELENKFEQYLLGMGFKEEETIKFKVGDKVCIDEEYYGIIEGYNKNAKQYYITKRQYDNEDDIILATPEEIKLYYN